MIRAALPGILGLAVLAGCDMPGAGGLGAGPEPRPALADVSPAARAALPQGVGDAFLIRGSDGCYGIAIEQTVPVSGVRLLDANGQPVCDSVA